MIVTIVYAKYTNKERLSLWDSIIQLANGIIMPWLGGGDFNIVLSYEKKIGGLSGLPQQVEDFALCINSSNLSEVAVKGSLFTWSNDRCGEDCIFEMLDRTIVNQDMFNCFEHIKVEFLEKTGLDHAPLFLSMGNKSQNIKKPFRFLSF